MRALYICQVSSIPKIAWRSYQELFFLTSLRLYFEAIFSLWGYMRMSVSVVWHSGHASLSGMADHSELVLTGHEPVSSTWHLNPRLPEMVIIPL